MWGSLRYFRLTKAGGITGTMLRDRESDVKKGQMIVIYHVFTDRTDLFTRSWNDALSYYRKLKAEGRKRRLYKEMFTSEQDFDDDVVDSEDCIYSAGAYPS